ncbi:MAG: TldD/PmbA family protein, partial [Spirochaetaceae bacterium]|nr:TldD/PmbA family protein [Spirochaetaceae bacterium]
MDGQAILGAALEEAMKAGADEAQATFRRGSKSEQNVDAGRMSLFRTTEDIKLSITAYAGSRKGSVSSNRSDPDSVRAAAREAFELAAASEPDPANAISPAAMGDFAYGDEEPDRGAMYDRVREFLARSREKYPKTNLEQCVLDFTVAREHFANTNGARFSSQTGAYSFFALFTTKDGAKASSFNYSGAARRALGESLETWGSIDELMRQSAEQLDPAAVQGKFVGDLIITPDCMGDFIEAL